MKYFSTFTGIGGFEIGIQNALESNRKAQQADADIGHSTDDTSDPLQERGQSATCVGYSEIDKYASSVFDFNFKGIKNYGDITKINAEELPDFDCLVGGFPCQAFSIAGKRAGFNDTRGTLFFDLARILRAKRPRLFVFENVKGLLSHDNGNTFRTIIAAIDELGYDCQWQVLNSKNHGVPQNRERIIIVGHLRGTPRPEVFPLGETNQLNDCEEQSVSRETKSFAEKNIKSNANTDKPILQDGENRPIHIRKLTPLECERLQAFPETEVSAIIDVCIDPQKNSVNVELRSHKSQKLAGIAESNKLNQTAPSVETYSQVSDLEINEPARHNVHIFLEGNRIRISNHEKSLSYASGATIQNSLVLPIADEDFAQMIAGMLRTVERTTTTGKAVSAQNEQALTDQENGNSLEKIYGFEMTLPVNDAQNASTILKEHLKSITSSHSDTESLGLSLATLSYYVASATSGLTEQLTSQSSTYRLHLTERTGWTQYAADGSQISDTQRYKMCGNAVTTNVIQAVFERILA